MTKIRYFDGKETDYFFKFYNYEKKIWDNEKNKNQHEELIELKKKIQNILLINEDNLNTNKNED